MRRVSLDPDTRRAEEIMISYVSISSTYLTNVNVPPTPLQTSRLPRLGAPPAHLMIYHATTSNGMTIRIRISPTRIRFTQTAATTA